MAGEPLTSFPLRPAYENVSYDTPLPYADPLTLCDPNVPWFSVKEAVLPFARFPGVDTILGPEMRSTGEVMGWDRSFARAFLKAQMGAGVTLPEGGRVFISIRDADKGAEMEEAARILSGLGFAIIATRGTAGWLTARGIACEVVNKVYRDTSTVLADQALKDRLFALGMSAVASTPADFARQMDTELARWAQVVKARKISAR